MSSSILPIRSLVRSSASSIRQLSTNSTLQNQAGRSAFENKLDKVSSRQSNGVHTPPSASSSNEPMFKVPDSSNQNTTTQNFRPPSFISGQTYNPSSISPPPPSDLPQTYRAAPLLGPSKHAAMQTDPLYLLNLHPGKPSLKDDSYKNGHLLSSFVSEMGRILPRAHTRLTRRSQREVGKAVRRARNMGLIPSLSRGKKGAGWLN